MLRIVRNVLVGVLHRMGLQSRQGISIGIDWADGKDVSSVVEVQRAEVVEETSYSGKPRLRCTVCGKVAFKTEQQALINRDYIESKGGPRMRPYKGRYQRVYGQNKGMPCGWWHLSRGRKG